jgi:hypothetical protein
MKTEVQSLRLADDGAGDARLHGHADDFKGGDV